MSKEQRCAISELVKWLIECDSGLSPLEAKELNESYQRVWIAFADVNAA